MDTPFLTLPLRRKRDFLRARQRTRQVAGLLGFAPREQAVLAAGVFEIACQAAGTGGRCVLQFQVTADRLQIFPAGPGQEYNPLRVDRPLPRQPLSFAYEDLPWMVRELALLTPLDPFEEFRLLNQEMLRAHLDVQPARKEPAPAGAARNQAPAA